jgi:hypothetical protein
VPTSSPWPLKAPVLERVKLQGDGHRHCQGLVNCTDRVRRATPARSMSPKAQTPRSSPDDTLDLPRPVQPLLPPVARKRVV